jgi:hypothetical protein
VIEMHVSLFDFTKNEGLRVEGAPAFSVQYPPGGLADRRTATISASR